MHQFRLALATYGLQQPINATFKSASEIGVSGLQFDLRHEVSVDQMTATGRRDLLHIVSEHGLTIASSVLPLNHPLYEPTRIDERVTAIRDAMKFAFSIHANTLCLRVGRIPEDSESKDRKLLTEVLCDLARYSNHIGTMLAITPTNDSAEAIVSLLNEVKTGPIGVDFDPAHFAMTGRPVADSLRQLHEWVRHVQLRDGIPGIDGGQEAAMGNGNVDWVEILALLGEMGYQGWLTAIRSQGNDRLRDVTRGIKMIKRILMGG